MIIGGSGLSDGGTEFVAVEHETGIELVLIPLRVGLLTNAITDLAKWAWGRWQEECRKEGKFPSTLRIEIPRSNSDAPPIRIELREPVTGVEIARLLKLASELPPV